jgi:hypothetical protein
LQNFWSYLIRLAEPPGSFYGESSEWATFSACLDCETSHGRPENLLLSEPQCPDYGQRGLGNLRVCFRNGPNKQRRVLACRTCQKRFSQRKGTPLYRAKLPEEKARAVLAHLQESCGVRQTGRLVGVNKNTVLRLAVLAGHHAQQLHDEFVAFSPADPRGAVR